MGITNTAWKIDIRITTWILSSKFCIITRIFGIQTYVVIRTIHASYVTRIARVTMVASVTRIASREFGICWNYFRKLPECWSLIWCMPSITILKTGIIFTVYCYRLISAVSKSRIKIGRKHNKLLWKLLYVLFKIGYLTLQDLIEN